MISAEQKVKEQTDAQKLYKDALQTISDGLKAANADDGRITVDIGDMPAKIANSLVHEIEQAGYTVNVLYDDFDDIGSIRIYW